jgi:hypothetical protein
MQKPGTAVADVACYWVFVWPVLDFGQWVTMPCVMVWSWLAGLGDEVVHNRDSSLETTLVGHLVVVKTKVWTEYENLRTSGFGNSVKF